MFLVGGGKEQIWGQRSPSPPYTRGYRPTCLLSYANNIVFDELSPSWIKSKYYKM